MSDFKQKVSEFQERHKVGKKFLKRFRHAARHLEKTGLTRAAALIKAGEIYGILLDAGDVTNVTSMVGRARKTA